MTTLPNALEMLRRNFISGFPKDAAEIIERMATEDVIELLESLDDQETIDFWEQLSPDISARILQHLPVDRASSILDSMDPENAALILALIEPEERNLYLEKIGGENAEDLALMLSYPLDCAGSMMDPKVLMLKSNNTVGEALDRVRNLKRRGIRMLFVVNDEKVPEGLVDVQDLATSTSPTTLDEIIRPIKATVNAMASRDEVVDLMEQYKLSDLPVLDIHGRLVGVVRQKSLVAAAEDEATAALQTMVGVSRDERALSTVGFAVRKRLPWLHINLATAFLAAAVVGLFESTIAANTALAVLLPVVAGQSGNTGAQALAVTMRGLALREIRMRHWYRVLFKEMSAGFWNGLAIALTTSIGVWAWSESIELALVIAISMVLSMVIAGMSGAAIPLILTWAKQDPAQSSSIVLTTVTDIAGFFSFLAIATLLLAT